MTAYLEHTYDLRETIVVSTSDGGSGYEKAVFDELSLGCLRHEHFRDPYHVNRKVKERLNFCPELHDAIFKALYRHDWDKLIPCFDTAESLIDAPNEKEKLEQLELLKKYLWHKWPYLASLEARGLSNYSGKIGTCEVHHRRYTYRMKRQGRYWSKIGAEEMVRVIDSLRNNELDAWLNEDPQPLVDQEEQTKRWKRPNALPIRKRPLSHIKGF